MKTDKELDSILDKGTAQIRDELIDPAVIREAADRVWERLAQQSSVAAASVAAEQIESCADFQSLIPAYMNGSLSEARSLLLVDHTHECIPCRRALKAARSATVPASPPIAPRRRFAIHPTVMRWGIAATLVIGFGLLALPFIQRYAPFGQFEATVEAAEGQVFQIADTRSLPVSAGEKLQRGELIRTAKDAHAFIRLGDGSLIEMKDRSEFSLSKNSQGTTIHLNRGAILVEAAKQRKEKLYVDTGDSLVAVTGTTFSVNSGTKGARVSVIEGEVKLDHAGSERVLKAGEQATTSRAISTIPVKDEIAWSRKAESYVATLASLNALNKELTNVAQPGLRSSTHLLDLMPENTIVYAAFPNLTTTITESHRIMQERLAQNAALREWYEKERAGNRGPNLDQVIETVREFGDYLGEEIAVSVSMDEKGEPTAPLVLAELKNATGFRQFLEQQIARFSGNSNRPPLQFVDDPLTATPAPEAGKKDLYVWIGENLFVATPKFEQLQEITRLVRQQSTSSFTSTPFHERIAQIYNQGAGLVVAANLERVVEQTKSERMKGGEAEQREAALQQLGVLSVKYFVLDQTQRDGKTHTRANLSFNESQRGIPSWLAAPGPMGSLEYVSPDANVVAGFVVKDPVRLVDDLFGVIETVAPNLRQNFDKLQSEHGLDIRRDVAAPLGGEFAFAIDGPILPTPSWKMVFEVNDPTHLQETLERVVGEVNKEAARFGKAGLVWDRTELGDRNYYTLRSGDFGVELNYTYVNGYMIVGPSRGLIERAVSLQQAGYSLVRSARFISGLPADGNANFSAVFYHNLAPLLQPVADRLSTTAGNLPQEQKDAIKSLAADMPPTLAYAYAEGGSITFAANTEGGPFGISPATLLGVPHALEIQHILQQGLKPGTK